MQDCIVYKTAFKNHQYMPLYGAWPILLLIMHLISVTNIYSVSRFVKTTILWVLEIIAAIEVSNVPFFCMLLAWLEDLLIWFEELHTLEDLFVKDGKILAQFGAKFVRGDGIRFLENKCFMLKCEGVKGLVEIRRKTNNY